MVLVTLAVLVWPLLRTHATVEDTGENLNLSVYRQQLQELEGDRDRGLVTEDQMERARMDIERALLSEVPEQPAAATKTSAGSRFLPMVLVSVTVIAVSVPVYMHIGYPDRLGEPPAANEEMPSPEEIIAILEQRLEQDPEDNRAWLILAQAYSALGRHDEAADTLEGLRERIGDEPGLLVRLANTLAMANDGLLEGRPARLIEQVLEQDPDNPSAMWFAGLAANQRGDYREAVDYWERLLPRLEGEPEAKERLQELIVGARTGMQDDADGNEVESPGVTIQVSLADGLEDRVGGDDTLYVFARAADGPAMPLAVVKHQAGELPLEVRLDDTHAMTPGARLSGHDSVTLVARISRSGTVQAESGDLQGEVTDVAVPAEAPVELVIDSPVP